jgi:hypothetical protein
MIRCNTFPHLTVDPHAIRGMPWKFETDSPRRLSSFIKDWDPTDSLELRRSLLVDGCRVASTSGVGAGAEIVAVASWRGGYTYLRGSSERMQIDLDNSRQRIDFALSVPGDHIAETLHLQTTLVLNKPGKAADELAAYMPGSLLWIDPDENPSVIQFQEGTSRFPVSAVDFVEMEIGDNKACWFLDWRPDALEMPALYNLRLYINKANQRFHSAITTKEPTQEDHMVRSVLRVGVARELLRGALECEKKLEGRSYEVGSTGHMLLGLINTQLKPFELADLVKLNRSEPGRFDVILQSRFGLFQTGSSV